MSGVAPIFFKMLKVFSEKRCFSLHQDLLRPFGAELGPTDHAEKSQVSSGDCPKGGLRQQKLGFNLSNTNGD